MRCWGRLLIAIILLGFLGSSTAEAASYKGYGDTGGYYHDRKQVCCDAAIEAAQIDSANACRRTGGFANSPRGVASGRCKWKTRQGPNRLRYYWCTGQASLRCRR